MTSRTRCLLAVLLVGAVAGCGPTSNTTPDVSAAPTPTAVPAPTATPTPSPTAAPTKSPSPAALPQGSEPVTLDPVRFNGVAKDNPFWPMKPCNRWVYRETDVDGTKQDVEVLVTERTKQIIGITATVVHDVVTEDGEVIEDTFDWYAQDVAGNLWYLGEDTKEFENGKVVSTEGSWLAGVNGAQPGVIMPARPAVGMTYRQEYYAGQAEDAAAVLSLDEHVTVPFGTFDGVLSTREVTALEPDVAEQKFYARGVGPIQVIQVSGGSSREELITFEHR